MRALTPKAQIIVWLTSGVVIAGGLAWFSFGSLGAKLAAQTTAIEDSLLTVELNRRESQSFSTLQKQVAEIQKNAEKLNGAFSNRTQALQLVEYFEKLAETYSLEQNFSPVEPLRNPALTPKVFTVEERDFRLTVSGSTDNVLRFLRDVEIRQAYLLVNDFTLQRGNGGATLTLAGTIPWH